MLNGISLWYALMHAHTHTPTNACTHECTHPKNSEVASCTYVATAPKVTCHIPAGIMGLSPRNSEIKEK